MNKGHGPLPFAFKIERAKRNFLAKVIKGPGCWEWTACVRPGTHAYGKFAFNHEKFGRIQLAHRFSYMLANGKLPPLVMHTCDNPRCVNPKHLKEGTILKNVRDCVNKGRHRNNPTTGDANNLTRVSDAEVIKIFNRLMASCKRGDIQKIANEYGVCYGTILLIKKGRRHVLKSLTTK